GGTDGHVYVWDVVRGQLASVLRGHTSVIIGCSFGSRGYLLATHSWDGTTRLWDAASGEPLVATPGFGFQFSPDDGRLAFHTGTKFGVWDVAHDEGCRVLHPGLVGNRTEDRGRGGAVKGDFSPDGEMLATSERDGVRLWEVQT